MKGAKTPGERRKKIHDKFSQHMSVLRIDSLRKPRYSNAGQSAEPKETNPIFDSPPKQNLQYRSQHSHNSQDMLCFESLVAMTPPSLFIPLQASPTMRLPVQTPYSISPLTPMQGQISSGNTDQANNFSLNNLTTNFTAPLQTENQQRQQNVFDLSSFFDESFFNPVPNTTNNLVAPSPPPPLQVDMTQQNVVPPSTRSYDMPSRPNPPSFIDGPQYFQASEDFSACFGKADADNSKFITLDELKVFLQNKDGSSFNDATAMTIMNMFDKNKDYMIDADEFPDMLAYISNWYSCFIFLDSDNSGTINFLEMHTAITCLGLAGLSYDFTASLLEKYVCAGSHEIRFDNFILACVTLCRFNEAYKFLERQFGTPGRLPQKLEQG
ncbi:hypothetical protein INT47_006335 [Mucor saturninus]|uniref:EF-hand domain-containing protein n=1 Tax=Mucor saturninus TaxID=64648 RepID=A0A8H7RKB1_9FUNG|nr:hypothetical protein INT47_006335 [Mucor saturninus]